MPSHRSQTRTRAKAVMHHPIRHKPIPAGTFRVMRHLLVAVLVAQVIQIWILLWQTSHTL